MPRNKKRRHCRCFNENKIYKPAGIPAKKLDKILLDIDEFESMRLCDYDGLSQTEAGEKMGISRGTVQRLLYSGRKKIIECLLFSKAIIINNNIENNGVNCSKEKGDKII